MPQHEDLGFLLPFLRLATSLNEDELQVSIQDMIEPGGSVTQVMRERLQARGIVAHELQSLEQHRLIPVDEWMVVVLREEYQVRAVGRWV